jgi:hypothetical protein
MQNQLPAVIQREKSYELDPQIVHSTMPAPENGFPHFEGYSVVSVKVREATITATNDPIDLGITDATPVQPHAIPMYDAGRQSNAAANIFSEDVLNRTMPQSGTQNWQQQAAADLTTPVAKRKRLIGKDAAIWICVAQLGVIIWMMSPVAQKFTQPGGISMPIATNNVSSAFNTAVMWPLNALGMAPSSRDSEKATKKQSGKKHSSKRSSSRGKMVPPPPPDVAVGRFFVPPPPVAYALPTGAGAVAASTLAHVADSTPAPIAKAKKIELPALTAQTASIVPADEPAPVEATTTSVASSESAPLPGNTSSHASAPVETSPSLFKSYNWQESMNSGMTPVVEQPQVQPIRTVMAGNRKRTITDR